MKTCSVDKLIAKIYRDFKPSNSGWIDDAVEWIGEAVSIMRVGQGYTKQSKEINIVDKRGKLPCNVENLLGFKYHGKRLEKSGAINHPHKLSELRNLSLCEESYSLNPNYINTTFEKGCVTCYFEGIELDCNGFPLIIDDTVYQNACEWYILRMMCLRGFQHQIVNFKLCDEMWEKYYPQAQNRFRMSTIDDLEIFKKMWTGAVRPTNLTNQFFNNTTPIDNSTKAHKPGSVLETFPLIEKPNPDTIIDNVN